MNVSHNQAYSYAEILEILSFTHIDLVKKIPQKLLSIFKENALSTYEYHLDKNIPLENQEISVETANLITLISLNYWCKTEEQKNELKEILLENEKIQNENLRKQYNVDNIFNNEKHISNIQTQHSNTPKAQSLTISSNNSTSNSDDSLLPLAMQNLPFFKRLILKFKNLLAKNK